IHNPYFGLTVASPDGWYPLNDQELRALLNIGEKMAAAESEHLDRVFEATRVNQVPLFGIFKEAPGAPIDFNPSVIAQAEKVDHAPGIKRGADYLFHTRKGLAQTGMEFDAAEEFGEQVIGGVTFDKMDVTVKSPAGTISQKYYAARHEKYVIILVASTINTSLDPILESIEFEW
ncbi:MAG: hypothetical protein AAGH38_01230, partial [Pseudomonadota bacterium]